MERRDVARKDVSLKTILISGSKSYDGIIGNVSEYGLYVKTSLTKTEIDFLPTTILELKFNIPSGKTINLLCEIIWLYSKKIQHPRLGNEGVLENNIGMEIKNSPPEYKNFVENL